MNETLFKEIYKKYYNRIFSYCYGKTRNKDLSFSISNDAFLLLYEKWDTVDFDADSEKLVIWLLRTAAFKIKEQIRKESLQIISENLETYVNTLTDISLTAEQALTYKEYLIAIRERLNEPDAIVFDLLAIQNMKQREAAGVLGISVGAVKMKWYRLKPKIKLILRDLIKEHL